MSSATDSLHRDGVLGSAATTEIDPMGQGYHEPEYNLHGLTNFTG